MIVSRRTEIRFRTISPSPTDAYAPVISTAWSTSKGSRWIASGFPVKKLSASGEAGTRLQPWVFRNKQGRPLHQNWSHLKLFRLLKGAGVRQVRFHDLRHSFASLLLQNSESPVYVKDQMGHSSIQVTVDLYGHLIPGGNIQAVDRLDSATPAHPRQPFPARFLQIDRLYKQLQREGMGWMTGFEPATSGSTIRRSNQLSYTHHEGKCAEYDRCGKE